MPFRRHIAILLTAVTEDDKSNGWRAVGGEGSVAPEGWSFPCRGGFIEGVTVLAHGEVRIDARTPYFPVPIAEGVSLLPMSRWGAFPNGGGNSRLASTACLV